MSTKRYIELITRLYTDNVIDPDFYCQLMERIKLSSKMTMEIYREFLTGMEKRGLFDEHTAPYREYNMVEVTAEYLYAPQRLSHKLFGFFARIILFLATYVVCWFWFGVKVKGRKNLKSTKGRTTVTLSNHMSYIDIFLTKRYAGSRRQYVTVAPFNMKKGFSEYVFKSVRVIPIPDNILGMKYLNVALDEFKKKKPIFHFYAERAMWIRYQKPRPQKAGAFFYAYKLEAPVVPILYCYRKPRGLRKLLKFPYNISIIIDKPIFPDLNLPRAESIKKLHSECETAIKRIYEDFYAQELIYENGTTLPSVITGENVAARTDNQKTSALKKIEDEEKV